MSRGKSCASQFAAGDAIAIASAAGQDGAAPKTIQLFAMGAHPSRNGSPPIIRVDDLAHAERIAAATAAHHRSNAIVVDYDHQSMFGARPGVGGQARASGWMSRVYGTDQGVFADVEWTEAAAHSIGAREYRYISPVFTHDKAGRPLCIINAALTNTPSLDLAAVASAFSTEEGSSTMTLANVAKALGLGEDASEEEILRAIANLNTAPATMTAIASALGAAEGVDLVATITTLKEKADKAGTPDLAKFVPVETVAGMTASIQSLQGTVDALQAKDRKTKIDDAQKAGSLPPSLVAHATAITDDASLDAFLGALPTTGLGKSAIDPGQINADGKLTEEQIALCTAHGWDQVAYLAELKKEAE